MLYLRQFETHADYINYILSDEPELNVSLCKDEQHVEFTKEWWHTAAESDQLNGIISKMYNIGMITSDYGITKNEAKYYGMTYIKLGERPNSDDYETTEEYEAAVSEWSDEFYNIVGKYNTAFAAFLDEGGWYVSIETICYSTGHIEPYSNLEVIFFDTNRNVSFLNDNIISDLYDMGYVSQEYDSSYPHWPEYTEGFKGTRELSLEDGERYNAHVFGSFNKTEAKQISGVNGQYVFTPSLKTYIMYTYVSGGKKYAEWNYNKYCWSYVDYNNESTNTEYDGKPVTAMTVTLNEYIGAAFQNLYETGDFSSPYGGTLEEMKRLRITYDKFSNEDIDTIIDFCRFVHFSPYYFDGNSSSWVLIDGTNYPDENTRYIFKFIEIPEDQ